VKFTSPNPYHVYLNDTPSQKLFAKTERAFSSECIRLERPTELAEYLLRDDPKWSRQRILSTIESGAEQIVYLSITIPVHLWYWTAWVNEQGLVNFRKDIYARDKVLEKALRESFSSPKARINPQ
jgi:L,D-transpeptidase YcbB